MKARLLESANVLKLVDLLREQGYEVFAPFAGRGRDTWFDLVTDENRDRVQVHLPNPYYPPKRFVLPHIERLSSWYAQKNRSQSVSRLSKMTVLMPNSSA